MRKRTRLYVNALRDYTSSANEGIPHWATMLCFIIKRIYSLDVIISVGYRVKSKQGVAFMRWANNVLKQYLIKGYAINQKRLDHYDDLKSVVNLMSPSSAFRLSSSISRWQGFR